MTTKSQREAQLTRALVHLAESMAQPGRARCMCCNSFKPSSPDWVISGYMPSNKAHPPVAYLVCQSCSLDPVQLRKGQLGIETVSRAHAEARQNGQGDQTG